MPSELDAATAALHRARARVEYVEWLHSQRHNSMSQSLLEAAKKDFDNACERRAMAREAINRVMGAPDSCVR